MEARKHEVVPVQVGGTATPTRPETSVASAKTANVRMPLVMRIYRAPTHRRRHP